MADENQDPQPEHGIDQRVASLEAGQHHMSEQIDKILGIVSGGGGHEQEATEIEDRRGGGAVAAHDIRAGIEEHERRKAAEAAEQAKDGRLAAAEAKIAELSEKPPEPMPRRVEKIMGWR